MQNLLDDVIDSFLPSHLFIFKRNIISESAAEKEQCNSKERSDAVKIEKLMRLPKKMVPKKREELLNSQRNEHNWMMKMRKRTIRKS